MRTNGLVAFARECLPCGLHHRWAPVAELERKVALGQCVRIRIAGKQKRYQYKLKEVPEPSTSKDSPTGITKTELWANAGIGSRAQILRARAKVEEYGRLTWRMAASVYTAN